MELTNNLRKIIRSLDAAKYRREHGLFVAEGTKCVLDTIAHFDVYALVATRAWLDSNSKFLRVCALADEVICQATAADIAHISQMKSAPEVIAVYRIPCREFSPSAFTDELVLALDCVQDPGNLGTILRTADWMGVRHVLASRDTVDVWSPKVVQATMGAISRVEVVYLDNLAEALKSLSNSMPIYGTFLDGDNIYTSPLSSGGVIVMGNEGRGVSCEVANVVGRRLLIPSYPPGQPTSESLNVATATAIVLSEFIRKKFV